MLNKKRVASVFSVSKYNKYLSRNLAVLPVIYAIKNKQRIRVS